jgi:probable F420-dependent oxidoreductase
LQFLASRVFLATIAQAPCRGKEAIMQYGILMFPTRHPIDVAVLARQAEALGFASLWVGEHPIMPVHSVSPFPASPDGRIPDSYSWFLDPFVTLARASAVTTKLKLGTGITLIPERNPLLLAKETATLDYFSGGRFIFGIGAGWNKEETEIMGGDFTHRWTQTREAIAAMKALWANEAAEYHGTHYDFPLVRSFPRPVQQPHPPIFLGGAARQVFKRIVAYGNGWMPTRSTPKLIKQGRAVLNELALAAGRDPQSIEIMAYIAPPNRAKLQALAEAGADSAALMLTSAPEAAALTELEQIAKTVL